MACDVLYWFHDIVVFNIRLAMFCTVFQVLFFLVSSLWYFVLFCLVLFLLFFFLWCLTPLSKIIHVEFFLHADQDSIYCWGPDRGKVSRRTVISKWKPFIQSIVNHFSETVYVIFFNFQIARTWWLDMHSSLAMVWNIIRFHGHNTIPKIQIRS